GGPIKTDRTFVFGSVQISRERRGARGSSKTVYSEAQRAGDFSGDPELANHQNKPGEVPGVLNDDLCLPRDNVNCTALVAGTPYSTILPGGQIPTSFFDPVSASLLDKYIPHPNHSSKTFVNSPVQPDDTYQVTLKLDQQVNDNNKLSAFYYLNDD